MTNLELADRIDPRRHSYVSDNVTLPRADLIAASDALRLASQSFELGRAAGREEAVAAVQATGNYERQVNAIRALPATLSTEDVVEKMARAIERSSHDSDESFEEAWRESPDVIQHNRRLEARAVLATIIGG